VSQRVCFIERDERGDRIRAVRLIGQHAEAAWMSPRAEGRYVSEAAEDAEAAAEWIAERLSIDGDKLGLIVLDTTGAHCAWVEAATAEAGAVRSAYGRGGEAVEDDYEADFGLEEEAEDTEALGARPTPVEAAIETLGPAYESPAGVRVGVLVAPDAIVRLLIDELDRHGVGFTGVASLWHLLGWMASPDAASSVDSARVVADSPTVSGGVMVTTSGRLLWGWCREDTLLAAGSIRLGLHDDGPIVTTHDVARLVNDWVAWSAQVGVAPGRIQIASCNVAGERVVGDADTLSVPGVASALADSWPEAVVDVDVFEDPVLELLRAHGTDVSGDLAPGHAMSSLALRPGRATRRVYQVAGLALACCGIALAALGFRWQSQAPAVRADADRVREAYLADMTKVEQDLGLPAGEITGAIVPIFMLTGVVDQKTRASEITRAEGKPIVRELESLSFLLGELGDEVELQKIDASSLGFTVQLSTENDAIVGRIDSLLSDLDMNSGPIRWQATATQRGSEYTVRMAGTWTRQGGQP
jgi:hypothetical protein